MPSKHLKTLIKIGLSIVVTISIFVLIPKAIRFFIPLVIGWLISLIANPMVKYFEKHFKVVRKHGSWLVIVGVLAAVIGVGYFALTILVKEAMAFAGSVPDMYASFTDGLASIAQSFSHLSPRLENSILNFISNIESSVGSVVGKLSTPVLDVAGDFARSIPHLLVMSIFMLLSAYFFIADKEIINASINKGLPKAFFEKWNWIKDMFYRAVGGYFIAQFKIMGVIAIILWIGLLLLKVNYAILWAIIIAMLDFLPFFGTGFVIWPWSVYELLTGNYPMVAGLLCIYLVCLLVHQLLQPKFVGNTVGMDSFTTLICMYIGYRISSVIGMIVAVPIGIIIINLYKEGAFNSIFSDIKDMVKDFVTYLSNGG